MKKDLTYYLTLFKLEGHETWRADLKNHKKGFEEAMKDLKAKITEKKVFEIDRFTGDFKEVK